MNMLKSIFGGNANDLSAADAKSRIDSQSSILILDVRQPDEFRSGHIAGAKLIPLGELPSRMTELPKGQDILCVCRSGARSSTAVGQLVRAGYKAQNMRGGMMGWQSAGYPVKKGM